MGQTSTQRESLALPRGEIPDNRIATPFAKREVDVEVEGENFEGKRKIIIDLGTGFIRAGISTEDEPSCVIPTVLGRSLGDENTDIKNYLVGNDALFQCNEMKGVFPMQHGSFAMDLKYLEPLISKTYETLGLKTEDGPVSITTTALSRHDHYERLCSLMFEAFNVPGLHLANQGVCSMYSSGKTTGVVASLGAGVIQTLGISDGYAIPHSYRRCQFGGNTITEFFVHEFVTNGYERFQSPKFSTFSNHVLANELKEKFGYICLDYEEEIKKCEDRNSNEIESGSFKLPDGTEFFFKEERFRCPEILFSPSFAGLEYEGIHEQIYNTISTCDLGIRPYMYKNIVLSGGCILFPNFKERLLKEIERLAPMKYSLPQQQQQQQPTKKKKKKKKKKKNEEEETEGEEEEKSDSVNNNNDNNNNKPIQLVFANEEKPMNSAWNGLALMSKLPSVSGQRICKKMYEESGPSLVHRKFLL